MAATSPPVRFHSMSHVMYRIRMVDASDDDVADTLAQLHRLTFFDAAAMPAFDLGAWWLAYQRDQAVAFAGVVPSTYARNFGYFSRVGVLPRHWGRGASAEADAGYRSAGAACRVERHRLRYDGQSGFGK